MKTNDRKINLISALFVLVWEEIKTMNSTKMKSLVKLISNYLAIKFFSPKKDRLSLENTTYRISSY